MVPKDLQNFLLFCLAWLVIIGAGIYFSIRDADKRAEKEGGSNGD